MAYVALYRSYRPKTFSEVVDQKAIVTTLKNAISHDKVAHAYLFCGPRGTGKTTMAKIFAKALNCESGPTVEPCLDCEICKGIQKGTIPDVIEIDAASNNGADDIRQLRDSVKFLPSVCRYKVYIIDEVHMLSNAAFNALLKTLEEPPKYVVFILATTEPYKLPNTILSRCQRFDFQAISTPGLIERIKYVASSENLKITDEAVNQIALSAEGGMRDALSLLDQVISYSTDETITIDDVLAVSGNVSLNDLLELVKFCAANESVKAIDKLNSLVAKGKEVPKIASDLTLFLRDILMFKSKINVNSKPLFSIEENKSFLIGLPNSIIYKWLEIINQAVNQMKFSNQKRTYFDLALLKMSDAKENADNALMDKINYLEYQLNELEVKLKENANKPLIKPALTTAKDLLKIHEELINEDTSYEDAPLANPVVEAKPTITEAKEVVISHDESFISIKDINRILNDGTKDIKERFIKEWPILKIKYPDLVAMNMLLNGNIVAASNEGLIVELRDTGFCDRVMSYANHLKILEILKSILPTIQEFYAIPHNVWLSIRNDFKAKFTSGESQPILDDIVIPVKMPVKPLEVKEDNTDSKIAKLKRIFGDKLEIKEI